MPSSYYPEWADLPEHQYCHYEWPIVNAQLTLQAGAGVKLSLTVRTCPRCLAVVHPILLNSKYACPLTMVKQSNFKGHCKVCNKAIEAGSLITRVAQETMHRDCGLLLLVKGQKKLYTMDEINKVALNSVMADLLYELLNKTPNALVEKPPGCCKTTLHEKAASLVGQPFFSLFAFNNFACHLLQARGVLGAKTFDSACLSVLSSEARAILAGLNVPSAQKDSLTDDGNKQSRLPIDFTNCKHRAILSMMFPPELRPLKPNETISHLHPAEFVLAQDIIPRTMNLCLQRCYGLTPIITRNDEPLKHLTQNERDTMYQPFEVASAYEALIDRYDLWEQCVEHYINGKVRHTSNILAFQPSDRVCLLECVL